MTPIREQIRKNVHTQVLKEFYNRVPYNSYVYRDILIQVQDEVHSHVDHIRSRIHDESRQAAVE